MEGGKALLEEQADRRRRRRRRAAGRGQGDRGHFLGDQEVTAGRFFRVAVAGRSMEPTLREGDWLLVRRLARPARVGELVVAVDPREPARLLVKRVAAIEHGQLSVAGDRCDASTDSRSFGPIHDSSVLGRPVLRYAPLARFGPVR
ncbi:MAG TPA: nickel-type superoxide dismutase maturation protease [Candidatus Limnocylindria bacterium]|nr:nickel-type superoxide dismutase maturation protease [Candidatus Limnocylindria bacterium]